MKDKRNIKNIKKSILDTLDGKKLVEFNETPKGVTIWLDGTWVLDASMMKSDRTLRINMNLLKELKNAGDIRRFELK